MKKRYDAGLAINLDRPQKALLYVRGVYAKMRADGLIYGGTNFGLADACAFQALVNDGFMPTVEEKAVASEALCCEAVENGTPFYATKKGVECVKGGENVAVH